MQKLPESAEHDPVFRIPSRVCQILAVLSAGSFLVIFSVLTFLSMFSDVSFLAVLSYAPTIVQRRREGTPERSLQKENVRSRGFQSRVVSVLLVPDRSHAQ